MKCLVLGFYGRDNLGDDLFQVVLHKFFLKYNFDDFVFANPDDIDTLPKGTDLVLVGGGDLINNFFMNKIRDILKNTRIPVYGVGIGFPYPDLVNKEYLDIFNIIVTRTKRAYDKLITFMPGRAFYEPDLVYMLDTLPRIKNPKIIGIFFANSICSPESSLINKLVEIVDGIARMKGKSCGEFEYMVALYSMNTSGSIHEDDGFLNRVIYDRATAPNVQLMGKITDPAKTFSNLAAAVCTRYHAHVLCLLAGVPFVSLYSTEKVRDLLETEGLLNFGVEMEFDVKLRPTDIDSKEVLDKFKNLKNFPKIPKKDTSSLETGLKNLLFYKPRFGKKLLKSTMFQVRNYTKNNKSLDHIAKSVTFAVANKLNAPFTWGLREHLNDPDYSLENGVKWILENTPVSFEEYGNKSKYEERTLNIKFFDRGLDRNVHRSGWNYVVSSMMPYHNPEGLLFHTFLDKLFGWNVEFFEDAGILPLKEEWMGIFHHTFLDSFSENNMKAVVERKSFQESLRTCKGLIVLSEYLASSLRSYVGAVPVHVIYHPTEFSDRLWKRADRAVQIGGWLRDPYAIYALPFSKLPKCVLKGRDMQNYFPPGNLLEKLQKGLDVQCFGDDGPCRVGCSRANKFVVGMLENIKSEIESVTVLEYLENDDYDELLESSVVFLNLLDASACNTTIEAIVRNTPIVVNKLPAIVEYLGSKYPLYYNTLEEAAEILGDEKKIKAGYKYLKKMDKSFLRIETFLKELRKIV